jgi:hypothetical protein
MGLMIDFIQVLVDNYLFVNDQWNGIIYLH